MALCFDDLLDVEGGMSVPLDLEVPNSVFELDNSSCGIVQTGMIKTKEAWPKKSPFHESDSGMSEDFCSVGSPESVDNLFERQDSGKMLDELVDSMGIEPFCNGSDQDLANYFGSKISNEDTENDISNQLLGDGMLNTPMSVSDESRPSSPEVPKRTLRSKNGKSFINTGPSAFKTVQPTTSVKAVARNDSISSDVKPAVQSVKVLKVIKTSGTANTATEVLKALDERNKKNAVQAKINREKKKQYIKCLEDEVSALKSRNGELETENDCMKQKTASLEEEVEYLRAVLANESGLSKVLGSIQNVKNVKLRSSFVSRKRSAEMDHDYTPSRKRRDVNMSTAGVCLHVDNDTVSLEFCSKCSKMAKSEDENE